VLHRQHTSCVVCCTNCPWQLCNHFLICKCKCTEVPLQVQRALMVGGHSLCCKIKSKCLKGIRIYFLSQHCGRGYSLICKKSKCLKAFRICFFYTNVRVLPLGNTSGGALRKQWHLNTPWFASANLGSCPRQLFASPS